MPKLKLTKSGVEKLPYFQPSPTKGFLIARHTGTLGTSPPQQLKFVNAPYPPPKSRSPMSIPSLLYVYGFVWEKNFIESRRKIAVYQFNEYGPCVGQGNKGGPTLQRGGVSVACWPPSFLLFAEKLECCSSSRLLWHFGHVPWDALGINISNVWPQLLHLNS